MKILKKVTTIKEEEIEISLPACFKDDGGYFYKINEDETVDAIFVSTACTWSIIRHYRSVEEVSIFEPITEGEWWAALQSYLESAKKFVFKHGMYDNGLPLPTEEDFESTNRDELLITN